MAGDSGLGDFLGRLVGHLEFERRQLATVPGVDVHIARQLRDVRGILAANDELDVPYLERWAGVLGVADLLATVRP